MAQSAADAALARFNQQVRPMWDWGPVPGLLERMQAAVRRAADASDDARSAILYAAARGDGTQSRPSGQMTGPLVADCLRAVRGSG